MKTHKHMKRAMAFALAMLMMFTMLPFSVFAASGNRTQDTIFFGTDFRGNTANLQALLGAMAYEPGAVVLGGDNVAEGTGGSAAAISAEIHAVYPGAQTFYTYGANDSNVTNDGSYMHTGVVYEGDTYYVYAIDESDMVTKNVASYAANRFASWAWSTDEDKVIFVISHMPLHTGHGDNKGGISWASALNMAGLDRDIVFLWGHNMDNCETDVAMNYVPYGGTITPEGGFTTGIYFTYVNAGYINQGFGTMAVVNEKTVELTRYNASGSVAASYSINRQYEGNFHRWGVVENVAATCTEDGYITRKCDSCGDSNTEVIPALGHDYTTEGREAFCTEDGYMTYTCTVCDYTYTEVLPAHGHEYVQKVVQPTCMEGGYTTNFCLYCGDSYITDETEVVDHSYITAVTPPTCVNGGYTTHICKFCNLIYEDSYVDMVDHSYAAYVVAPTCTEGGYTTYTCTFCRDSYTGDETAATGHNYTETVTAPTCAAKGYTTHTCDACGDSYKDTYVDVVPHDYERFTVDATCTTRGTITYICKACDASYSVMMPALGHYHVAAVVAPTCTEEGYTEYTCIDCGDSYITDLVDALGHNYSETVIAPTCTEEGYTTCTCTACGDTYDTDLIDPKGHAYRKILTQATCTEDGYFTSTCKVCGDSYVTAQNPATGHQYQAVVTAPTCTEGGYTTYTCVNAKCGDFYVADETAATGHSYAETVTAPTCTEDGCTTHTCTACGDSYVTDVADALGHDYDAVVTAPTCTEDGYTTYTCAVCEDVYTDDVIAADGHAYHAVITEPTCTEGGYTTYTCDVCDHSYNGDNTAALGHNYAVESVNGYYVYTCVDCGDTYSEEIPNYVYSKVSRIAAGDSYVITLYSGKKYYAVTHSGNELSVVQVNVSGGKITSEITEDMVWTYDNKNLFYKDGAVTYYLYSDDGDLGVSSFNASTISFSNYRLKVDSYRLCYSGNSAQVANSATTTYLFQQIAE